WYVRRSRSWCRQKLLGCQCWTRRDCWRARPSIPQPVIVPRQYGAAAQFSRRLTEREGEYLNAEVKERDLAGAIGDRPALPDELVEPLLGDDAVAMIVGVAALGLAWRLPVN